MKSVAISITLKDFKYEKIEIHKIYLLLMRHLFGNLATIKINMSAIHVLNFISK